MRLGFGAGGMRLDLGGDRILPRWVVAFFLAGAVVLLPWDVLMFVVPQVANVPKHWVLVWGGFDCFLILGFGVTAFRLMTRSPKGAVTSAMTGTLLLIDAWFDVLTTRHGGQAVSILMAVFAEIPCAVICFYASRRIVKLFEQAKDILAEAGFIVRNGRLLPPAGFPGTSAISAEDVPGAVADQDALTKDLDDDPDPADPDPVTEAAATVSERGLGGPVVQQRLLAEPL